MEHVTVGDDGGFTMARNSDGVAADTYHWNTASADTSDLSVSGDYYVADVLYDWDAGIVADCDFIRSCMPSRTMMDHPASQTAVMFLPCRRLVSRHMSMPSQIALMEHVHIHRITRRKSQSIMEAVRRNSMLRIFRIFLDAEWGILGSIITYSRPHLLHMG